MLPHFVCFVTVLDSASTVVMFSRRPSAHISNSIKKKEGMDPPICGALPSNESKVD